MNKVDFPVVNHIEIHDGQARIVGRNLKVKMVISRLFHGTGATIEAVMEQYNLTRSEVLACAEYYYDHKDAIDRVFEQEDAGLANTAAISSQWKAQMNARLNTDETK
jgi:uncharacterized protein (DUF433 family)